MKTIIAALAAFALPAAAGAQTVTEKGDAGQTLATAQDATLGGTGALTGITGALGSYDADLFRIYIASPKAFSATTTNAATENGYAFDGELDTALFLFDSAGHAVATDDDEQSGLHLTSTLPAGNALYVNLAAGYYYLGVSVSGNEPVNAVNQLLFTANPSSTAVRGPASGLNPTTLAGFDGNTYDGTPGTYEIDLTGVTFAPSVTAAVPEPAAWTLMIGGLGLAGGALRRRSAKRTGRRATA